MAEEEEDEYGIEDLLRDAFVSDPTSMSAAIDSSKPWLLGDSPIVEVEDSLNTILNDHQTRFKVAMVALARRRASDVLLLDETIRQLENLFQNPKFINLLLVQDPGAVVKLYNSIKARQDSATNFLWKVLEGGFPNRLEDQAAHVERLEEKLAGRGISLENLTPTKREKLRGIIREITKELKDEDTGT